MSTLHYSSRKLNDANQVDKHFLNISNEKDCKGVNSYVWVRFFGVSFGAINNVS